MGGAQKGKEQGLQNGPNNQFVLGFGGVHTKEFVANNPRTLLIVGAGLVVASIWMSGDWKELARELGGLLVLAWFALEFIERPLRTRTAAEIRETASSEISRIQNQTIERLLRGWLPPAHFQVLQRTMLLPFLREETRWRIRLFTDVMDGVLIPAGYVGEKVDYRYRLRNISETTQATPIGFAMSKESAGVLADCPHLTVSADFEDGTPAIAPQVGGEDRGDYIEFERIVQLPAQSAIVAEIYTKELRWPTDRDTLICPMPASGMVVDVEFSLTQFEVMASALHPAPAALLRSNLPGGQGIRFSLPGPLLPGTSMEVKWKRLPPQAEQQQVV